MVSRSIFATLILCFASSLATAQNFITFQRSDPARSQEIVNLAERYRRDIAIAWFGQPLPTWSTPCIITWQETNSLGGGETTYAQGRNLTNMRMQISGNWKALRYDTLPHEVFHLVMADATDFTWPRWMNEGAATTTESDDLITMRENQIVRYLKTQRGIPFNQLINFREYPQDVSAFYAQSASLVRFLLEKGGAERFIALGRRYQETRDWYAAFRDLYGYEKIGDLQNEWVEWVGNGSPEIVAKIVRKEIPRSQAPFRPTDTLMSDRALQQSSTPQNLVSQCGTSNCPPQMQPLPQPTTRPSTQPTTQPGSQSTTGGKVKIDIDYSKLAAELAKFPELRGKDGKDGKDGVDGKDGMDAQGLSDAQINAISIALLEQMASDSRFRGPAGEITDAQIADLTEQIKRGLNRRVLLVDGKTREIIDDETYEPGEPFVFDINKISKTRASTR